MADNVLYYGDNLDVLRDRIASESVDLVYLDPPFNSNRSYNVLFTSRSGDEAPAQIEAFGDTWTWSAQTEAQYEDIIRGGHVPAAVADVIEALRKLLSTSDMLAYLVMMAPRLAELHRVLKPSGSLFLHCDPTASHYLKLLLDAVFGPQQFRNEIVWKRSTAHSDAKQGSQQAGRIHDLLLFYSKGSAWTWNTIHTPYDDAYIESKYRYVEEHTGRRYRKGDLTAARPGGDTSYAWKGRRPYKGRYWAYSKERMEEFEREGRLVYTSTGMPEYKRYLDEMPGVPLQDVWMDIDPINSQAAERLGYPTQKPEALLERVIAAVSNEGDVVLDPFCGCGTTIAVAQRMRRRWVGIDITFIAVDLIEKRLLDTYGPEVRAAFTVDGIPRDWSGARALFDRDPFDFERWAVSLVSGQPNEKQVGDRGVDGIIRVLGDRKGGVMPVPVSVKGGKQLTPGMVRDLLGVISARRSAELGVLVTLHEPTRGMREAAAEAGTYLWPVTGKYFPRLQLADVRGLLAGKRPDLPPAYLPYVKAKRKHLGEQQALL